MWEHSKKMAICKTRREYSLETRPSDTSVLDLQPPALWEINFCCLSHSLWDTLLWKPWKTNVPLYKIKIIYLVIIIFYFFIFHDLFLVPLLSFSYLMLSSGWNMFSNHYENNNCSNNLNFFILFHFSSYFLWKSHFLFVYFYVSLSY